MDINEAAEILGLNPQTLRAQVRLRKLKAHRMAGRLFVTPAEVERYSRENLKSRPRPEDDAA